jgi:hypothetical protein
MKVGSNELHSRNGNVLEHESPWPVCRLSRHGLSFFSKNQSIEPGLLVLAKAKQVTNCQPSPDPKGLTHEKCKPRRVFKFPAGLQRPHASAGLDGQTTNRIRELITLHPGRQVVVHARAKDGSTPQGSFPGYGGMIEAVGKHCSWNVTNSMLPRSTNIDTNVPPSTRAWMVWLRPGLQRDDNNEPLSVSENVSQQGVQSVEDEKITNNQHSFVIKLNVTF